MNDALPRYNNIISILSLKLPYKASDYKKHFDQKAPFDSIVLPTIKKSKIKVLKNLISGSFSAEVFFKTLDFDFVVNPMHYDYIFMNPTSDPLELSFYAIYILYSYIIVAKEYTLAEDVLKILALFRCICNSQGYPFQNLFLDIFSDFYTIILNNFSLEVYNTTSKLIINYLSDPSMQITEKIATLLVINMGKLIKYNDKTLILPLLQIISQNITTKNPSITPIHIEQLIQIIASYLILFDSDFFPFFQEISNSLKNDMLFSLACGFVDTTEKNIKEVQPFIEYPSEQLIIEMEPNIQPNRYTIAEEDDSFELDLNAKISVPEFNFDCLVEPSIKENLYKLLPVILNSSELAKYFCDRMALDVKDKSADFCSFYIYLIYQVYMTFNDIVFIFPKEIFDPRYPTFENKFFYSFRSLAVKLMMQSQNIDLFPDYIESFILFPLVISDLFELLMIYFEIFIINMANTPGMRRAIRKVAIQLQYTNKKETNKAQNNLCKFLKMIFESNLKDSYFHDQVIIPFIVSQLFRPKMRPFVLKILETEFKEPYIASNTEDKENLVISQINSIIRQVSVITTQKNEYLTLINDVMVCVNNNIVKIDALLVFVDTFYSILEFLDDTPQTHDVLIQIIKFFVNVSIFSPGMIKAGHVLALGIPLSKFTDLTEIEYKAINELAANAFSPEHFYTIKQPYAINVMFTAFEHRESCDVIGDLMDLTQFSVKNCSELHRSKFDLLLLESLKNRRDSTPFDKRLLVMLSNIAVIESSTLVVHHFLNLMALIEKRYIPMNQKSFLNFLLTVLNPKIPTHFSSISSQLTLVLANDDNALATGFTICCWICISSKDQVTIFKLFNDKDLLITINASLQFLYVNDLEIHWEIHAHHWFFLTVSFSPKLLVYINTTCINSSEYVMPTFGKVMKVVVGNTSKVAGKLGNIGLFKLIDYDRVLLLHESGPKYKAHDALFFVDMSERKGVDFEFNIYEKPFGKRLLKFFKAEVFLPLIAQFNLTRKDNSHIDKFHSKTVKILEFALKHEKDQINFFESDGCKILSHILRKTDPKLLTFQFYQGLYMIYKNITYENLKKSFFWSIFCNFDLLTMSDHCELLRLIVNSEYALFSEFFSFISILEILRTYYFYKGMPDDIPFDLKKCRTILLNAIIQLDPPSSNDIRYLVHDIITLEDEQRIELLQIIPQLKTENIPDLDDLLLQIHPIVATADDLTVQNIIHVFKVMSKKMAQTQKTHTFKQTLDIISRHLFNTSISDSLRQFFYSNFVSEPSLFGICSMIAYKSNDSNFFSTITPSPEYCKSTDWAVWPILNALSYPDTDFIYEFLVKCSNDQFLVLFGLVKLISHIIGKDQEQECRRFLMILSRYAMLNLDIVVQLMFQFIFFREDNKSLTKEYKASSFNVYEECEEYCDGSINELVQLIFNIFHSESFTDSIYTTIAPNEANKFGLRLNEKGEWQDVDLALQLMSLVHRIEKPERFLKISLITAGFLSVIGCIGADDWLETFNVTKVQKENAKIFFDFYQYMTIKGSMKHNNPAPENFDELGKNSFAFLDEIDDNEKNSWLDKRIPGLVKEIQEILMDIIKESYKLVQNPFEFPGIEHIYSEKVSNDNEKAEKLWRKLWRNLTVSRGPWDFGTANEIKWKRDQTLCGHNCPFKIKPKKRFKTHLDASLTRDVGSYKVAVQEFQRRQLEAEQLEMKNTPHELFSLKGSDSRDGIVLSNLLHEPASKLKYTIKYINIKYEADGFLYFEESSMRLVSEFINPKTQAKKMKEIPINPNKILHIFWRRRAQITSGIEIFMIDGKSYFIVFEDILPIDVIRKIMSRYELPAHQIIQKDDFMTFFENSNIAKLWQQGKLTNFDFLLNLNLYSGRSFNDPSQYPFFPWVISNYIDEKIDLEDPKNYRDLTKPIGAIGEERLKDLKEKLKDLALFHRSTYLYGSYVISPLSLFLWMIRIEPFTSLHVELQSGKFDHASRVFQSIPDAYHLVSSHLNDYRELIPEFYFMPEFLLNMNKYDLGHVKQRQVDDVVLPKWAPNPMEFVYTLRKALESDITSEKLHEWVNLIWGPKSRGDAAKAADNLYLNEMYDSAWTPEAKADKNKCIEIEATMINVGQVPPQLFSYDPPKREKQKQSSILTSPISTFSAKSWSNIAVVDQKLIAYTNNIEILNLSTDGTTIFTHVVKSVAISNVFKIGNENFFLLNGGKINNLQIKKVSLLAADGKYAAAFAENAILFLIGPDFLHQIPFYGEGASCLAISRQFGIVVVGTESGSLVICSLFEHTKIRVINLEKGIQPLKLLITPEWGFIVTHSFQSISGKIVEHISVHNVNGMLIDEVPIQNSVLCWTATSSRDGFDYVIYAGNLGKLYIFEAYYPNVIKPIHRCFPPGPTDKKIKTLYYDIDKCVIVAVSDSTHKENNTICFVPYVL